MSAATKQQVLPFTRDDIERSIPDRFERVVEHFPEHLALTGKGQRWTYRELNRQINRIAHAIREGTRPGVGCVAYLLDHSPEMVIATLAILKAGKTYLALHPRTPAAAQQEVINEVRPELIVTTAGLQAQARKMAAESRTVLLLDETERWPDENPFCVTMASDPSTIFYTSGTTGQPKAVVKSHRAVLHRVWLSTQHDFITTSDRQSLLTHCSFSASESDIFGALLQGASLHAFDIASEGLAAFGTWLEAEKITLLHPPALLFRRFLSTVEGTNMFPSVRLVALAGDVVLPADVKRWRRHFAKSCVLLHRFSITETALLSVGRIDSQTPLDGDIVSAGKPVADKQLTLIDEEGRTVPQGEIGELVVKSRYLAEGYWRRPEDTASVFTPDPEDAGQRIYRTGDLGQFRADGSFVFLGRRDHQVKIRGFRVDSREIESTLLQLPEVREATTVVHTENGERCIVAFVALQDGVKFDEAGMRTRLTTILPDWKIPARFYSIDNLPITITGKVDRKRLEAEARILLSSGTAGTPPTTLEEELAEIWRAALRLDAVSVDDNFLQLGGDSISTMTVLGHVKRRYGITIPYAEFFGKASIRQIAQRIRSSIDLEDEAEENLRTSDLMTDVVQNVSDAFVELLNANGVDFIFINPGSDSAPILESIAKFKAAGRRTPELILCQHESVAMAAAHGHFMVSGRPQVVLVHVDVGTLNIGANLHNAQRGRAGVVICAGRTPYTVGGEVPGARNRRMHWIQEQFNQAGIVEGYVKWHYELTCAENLEVACARAFQVAASEPAGPVYLTLPREVLMSSAARRESRKTNRISAPSAAPEELTRAAQRLVDARSPVILVSYAGRNPNAVEALTRLAETLAAPVVETRYRVNFPSTHPLHLGFSQSRLIQEADCILVVDHDVPWVPAQVQPQPGCWIVHVDSDPLKRDVPIWGFPVDLAIQADSAQFLAALQGEIARRITPEDQIRRTSLSQALAAEHHQQAERRTQQAQHLANHVPIAPEWAALCVNEILDANTVIVSEASSNTHVLWNYLQLDTPSRYYESMGSGLGWAPGAALGVKLAEPSRTVICIVGDGSWLFSSPIASYCAAEQYRSPFLTVIFNNEAYHSTTEAIVTLAGGSRSRSAASTGFASKAGAYPACTLPNAGLLSRVAEAIGLWTATVDDPAALKSALRDGLEQVRSGRSALVNIRVSSSRPLPELSSS